MIISHRYRFVIVTPPKTGSTTLHNWFIREPFCDWEWEKLESKKGQHDSHIPEECKDYLIGFSWRWVLERNVSLWKHAQNEVGKQLSFEQYVKEFQPTCSKPFHTRSQESFLPLRVDYLFRVHRLDEDILNFPPVLQAAKEHSITTPIPKMNRTKHDFFLTYYTPELKRIVLQRFPNDSRIATEIPLACEKA